ncbi:mas-related G-protein coupled receptor member X2-like [Ochotona curzoniae]|uniref:mas-related G-protein coupled receptor member X2-like n=1 Tax=Ochotona curzoniae TaxID=130825 RepID=UPI001B349BB4|nr:mas-related G-protein coupled receptor member X2-like [Ochotona curzoniae]
MVNLMGWYKKGEAHINKEVLQTFDKPPFLASFDANSCRNLPIWKTEKARRLQSSSHYRENEAEKTMIKDDSTIDVSTSEEAQSWKRQIPGFRIKDTTGGFLSTNSSIPVFKMEQTMNGTDKTPIRIGNKETLILELLIFMVALVGLPGNMTVLYLLSFHMRRNAFSIYVLNLAGADFLFLCCQVIVSMLLLFDFLHLFSIPSPTYNILLTASAFSYTAGLSMLSAISTERCLSILWPIWYRCRRPRHLSAVACALLWALCLPLSILEMNVCSILFSHDNNNWCKIYNSIAVALLIILFLMLFVSSLVLLLRVLCSSRKLPLTRLYVTLLLTVLIFVLCGLPCGIYWSLIMWKKKFSYDCPPHSYLITLLLSCVNSSANPIIYFFVGSFQRQQRRQTLKQVLQRALHDTPEMAENGSSFPQETLEMSESTFGP